MNQEKGRKSYLVMSIVAMAVLTVGAVFLSSSYSAGSTYGLSGAKTIQDETDDPSNDGLSVSDGDGETADDPSNDGLSVSDGDGETADDNNK